MGDQADSERRQYLPGRGLESTGVPMARTQQPRASAGVDTSVQSRLDHPTDVTGVKEEYVDHMESDELAFQNLQSQTDLRRPKGTRRSTQETSEDVGSKTEGAAQPQIIENQSAEATEFVRQGGMKSEFEPEVGSLVLSMQERLRALGLA